MPSDKEKEEARMMLTEIERMKQEIEQSRRREEAMINEVEERKRREEELIFKLQEKEQIIQNQQDEIELLITNQKKFEKEVNEVKKDTRIMQENFERQKIENVSVMKQQIAVIQSEFKAEMQAELSEFRKNYTPVSERQVKENLTSTYIKQGAIPKNGINKNVSVQSNIEERGTQTDVDTEGDRKSENDSDYEERRRTNEILEKKKEERKRKEKKKKEEEARKRKMKENRRRNISIDSLGTESSTSSGTDTDSDTDSSDSARKQKTILIREPTKVEPFDVYSGKKIEDFFTEYEKYCKQQYPENKKMWCTKLKESLTGRMKKYYDTATCVEDPKYEIVKQRIIGHVHRVKAGIKYKKRDQFEKARMEKDEAIDEYAHRLETLAWKKFGNQDMDENKELMKKFLDTIPEHYAEFFNLKRKEKLDWTKKRLNWTNILDILEDASWEHGEVDEGYVRIRQGQAEFNSYKDALLATPPALNPPQNPSVSNAHQSSPPERDTTNNRQRYDQWNNQNRQMNNNGQRYNQWNNQPNSTEQRGQGFGQRRPQQGNIVMFFRCNSNMH